MVTKRALAVVACDGKGHGVVVWHIGLNDAIEEPGLYDLGDIGLDDAPQGIQVLDGRLSWWRSQATPDRPEEWDFEIDGEFRDPTPDEWAAILEGRNPFADRMCQHVSHVGLNVNLPGGTETEELVAHCDEVAEHDGLCERHGAGGGYGLLGAARDGGE